MSAPQDGASQKDHWSSKTYSNAAGFVPKLTQKVLAYLDPQPTDRILDVGCGDGKFTAHFASKVAEVYGVDASPSFIASATEDHGTPTVQFKLLDCRFLDTDTKATNGTWDKVVSNAALHWILRDESTRLRTLKACFAALKPGGIFVFEMGGAGNVPEAHAALLSALIHRGFSPTRARDASPWFFPSETWMRAALQNIGFHIETLELEYRPTQLTRGEKGNGDEGLEGWVRLMGASMLEVIDDGEQREQAVREICDVLESIVTHVEDGSQWLGYVRLRGVATRPGPPE